MKRMIAFLLVVMATCGPVFADDESDNPGTAVGGSRKAEGKLVNLESSLAIDRIDDLQRRFQDLERSSRYLDERVRSLERTVDELRRHR